MMRQYLQVKADYPDCILFFRLGDFYEMFFEDAELASGILDIALTSRAKGKDSYPMCGVPAFAASGYINKLVSAGHKVAICDQVEDPAQAKGIVKREVTRVVSPGMITEPEDLDGSRPNYLAAVWLQGDDAGLAYLDVSTAEFRMTDVDSQEQLLEELARVEPREVLATATALPFVQARLLPLLEGTFCRQVEEGLLERAGGDDVPADLFTAHQPGPGRQAARLLYGYARSSLPGSLEHVRRLVPYRVADHLIIDHNTRVNLELLSSMMEGGRRESLLGSIDRTTTPMGARLLARWMLYPLVSVEAIRERQEAVEQLLEDGVLRQDLRRVLGDIRDLERLLAKATVGQPAPRDLGRLRDSLRPLPELMDLLGPRQETAMGRLLGPGDALEDLFQLLDAALVDDPPLDLSAGGAIRAGYDERLDRYSRLASDGRAVIASMEERERQATGIGSLKIKYNRVFGYFIEVTKPNLDRVPDHYRRKQTTANAERFETEELKQTEQQILDAQDNRVARERTIIEGLAERVRTEA
ncbi:MAG: DNA mismatch repair protein MutS, partial [Deltaproteobacteria bacterium]